MRRVGTSDLYRTAGVSNDVAAYGDVFNGGPRCSPVLVARCEQDRIADLRLQPAVLQQIALDKDPPGAFQFEKVLDLPPLVAPGKRLCDVVPPERHVLSNQPLDRRVRPAQQKILAGTLEVIVLDRVW